MAKAAAPKLTKTAERKLKKAAKAAVAPAAKPQAKKAAPAPKPAKAAPGAALCKKIVAELDKNKAEEIVTLPLTDCSFADFMIVASGRAPRHVVALADYVAELLRKNNIGVLSIEGKETGDWVLLDAGDIVVHLFRPEVRQFYNLEKMWALPAATAR